LKELARKFSEVEKRVKALVMENHVLKSRIHELDQELEKARLDVRDSALSGEKQLLIREKIERVLKTLDAVGDKTSAPD
jgi:dynactin complex subunit